MTTPRQDDAQHAAREYAKYHSGIAPVTTIGEKLQTAFLAGRESVPDSSAQLEAARKQEFRGRGLMAAFSAQELRLLDDAVARAVISTMLDDDEAEHQKYLDLQNRLQEALEDQKEVSS